MLSKSNKALKNICAVFLVMSLMVLSFIPAFAEEAQITLSETNIVTYPTIEGEIYFTQKVGDCLTLSGGKVTTDGSAEGEEIPGHFEWLDPNFTPTSTVTAMRGSIKFIPENEDLYSTIEVTQSRNMRFYAKAAPMALADPDTTVTADIDKVGCNLLDAKINEVPVICTLSGETVDVKWQWTTVKFVNESGFYPAKVTKTGYEPLMVDVYIEIPGDAKITQYPTIKDPPVQWHEGLKVGDLELEGGEATVPGDFSLSNPDKELKAGNNSIEIVFTPQDELALPFSKKITLYLEKADTTIIDENGEAYVPEITLTLGTWNLNSLRSKLQAEKANCGTFKIGDINIEGIELRNNQWADFTLENEGEYTATAQLEPQNTNYTNITVQFKIVAVKKTVTPRISWYIDKDELIIDGLDYTDKPLGTFKVYANGELIESTKDGVKYLTRFAWRPAKSGTYTFKAEYTPAENDKIVIENNVIEQDITGSLKWTVTGKNVHFESRSAYYGEEVMVDAAITNDKFGGWKFYDENGKEIKDFNYTETAQNLRIRFIMPDHPITVEAVDNTQVELPGGDSKLPDFFSKIINWINNLITKIKALFDAIIQSLMLIG